MPIGTHPVKICVVSEEVSGDRYACVKVEINKNKVMRYELAMVGNENLDEEMEKGDYFGFGVDCGMACIADVKTQEAFKKYWKQREREEEGIDPYNDLFDNLLEENFKTNPKYQRECGDWLNWRIPETEYNVLIFASGWGDGYYPCYFGYDVQGKISAVYIHFIDIQSDYID